MDRSIDTFTIAGGIIIASGWTSGRTPKILYRGNPLKSSIQFLERPDVVAVFGKKAARWGFQIAAATDSPEPCVQDVAIRFGRNDIVSLGSKVDIEYNLLFDKFVNLVQEQGGSLLEIGSRARSGNIYKSMFSPEIRYTGLDVMAGPNVDIIADAHHLSRTINVKFDFVFSISVFEHLLMPWKVAIEINKILNIGGIVYTRSHQTWPIHEEPWDFWRFSDNAWRGIFNAHTGFEIMDTDMAIPGFVSPRFAGEGAIASIERQTVFLSSSCMVRKIADPIVNWDAEISNVYNIGYNHS